MTSLVIDLAEQHVQTLAHWASVRRTIEEVIRLLEIGKGDDDEAYDNVSELRELIPAIEAAHVAIRQAGRAKEAREMKQSRNLPW